MAVIDSHSRFAGLWDMPVRGGEGKSREMDVYALLGIVQEVQALGIINKIALEWPQTRPDEAPEASKRFGVGLGNLEAAFFTTGVYVTRVAPNKWKGRLGLHGKEGNELESREASVRMAEEFIKDLQPDTLRGIRGGLKDGRAEALLIAWESLTSTREGLANLDADTRLARVMFGSGNRRRRGGGLV